LDIQEIVPIVIYDNACHLCAKFANTVNFLARGKIALVGHYTKMGEKLRKEYLDTSATEMFWFIDGKNAYGGRSALFPLFCEILFPKRKAPVQTSVQKLCNAECKSPNAVFVRSASLLTHSRKIRIS
jgi:predicted DCC family thiol-disulfide oxidoreductase YuxK